MLPGERIAKFDLRIRSAMTVGFCSIPIGWRITIDNDPSWLTEVSGLAVVGAADLEPATLQPWFLSLLSEPGDRRERTSEIKVSGSMTFSKGNNTRVVEVTDREVSLQRLLP